MIAPYLCFDGPVPNQLYVIGGRDNNQARRALKTLKDGLQEPLDVVEMFDAWNGRPFCSEFDTSFFRAMWLRWVTCPDMLAKRAGCASAPLPNGCLLVCGGLSVLDSIGSCKAMTSAA